MIELVTFSWFLFDLASWSFVNLFSGVAVRIRDDPNLFLRLVGAELADMDESPQLELKFSELKQVIRQFQ